MTTVLCHGSFRFPHIGHLEHFWAAKKYGDELVVSITGDKYLAKPSIFDEHDRALMIYSLRLVDGVIISHQKTGAESIREVKPDFYVKGIDYRDTGVCEEERRACEEVGAKIVYTTTPKRSSTEIVEFLRAA